jgi:hypothetical protein
MMDGAPPGEAAGAANLRVLRADFAWLSARLARETGPTRLAGAERRGCLLDEIAERLGLSAFERDVLLLAAAPELASFAAGVALPGMAAPSFALAFAALPEAHWSALLPTAPLRRWRLVEVVPAGGEALVAAPLRVEERLLHHLLGLPRLDARLAGRVVPVLPRRRAAPPSDHALVLRLAHAIDAGGERALPYLSGAEGSTLRDIAARACDALALPLHRLHAADLPQGTAERELFAALWEREVALGLAGVLLLEDHDAGAAEGAPRRAAEALLDRLGHLPLILAGSSPPLTADRAIAGIAVPPPGRAERQAAWREALADAEVAVEESTLQAIAAQFPLGPAAIRTAAAGCDAAPGGIAADILWDRCRAMSPGRLEALAERIESAAGWDDLVLPAAQMQALRDVAANLRARDVVHEAWGFAPRGARGLGTAALFAGPSGTGKTMAAEVLARELRLDLFRIDLSQVVSKYIGETEKNLKRVFDAAEAGGAILLFDEADALFGRRSEVKDSHDRYANIEVSYLLQRMEAYRGLAVLTTNQRTALDHAFLRRLRFVVHFPFPDAAQRAEIWRRAFPAATPTEGLDPVKLARLGLAGGHIRNIALQAAFHAADQGEPVRMAHLLRAARAECAKLERPLGDAEVAGWA